eukprot:TRINITY_DN12888_c0_g1_i1.p1 TRINITY_DN12888_c0_g1~~TRINITY_DN12888_c0_g1_i1.p1  ORF type:complete len:322 (-),score=56.75 TRINITY_DN12888_c0_g1_i1:485-1450(-)
MSDNSRDAELPAIGASQPEILRVNQKDEEYIQIGKERLIDALELFAPYLISYRTLSQNSDFFKMVAQFGYYSILLLSNTQTLGEEYSYLRPHRNGDPVLSTPRKILYIILSSVVPFVANKYFKNKYGTLLDNLSNKHGFLGILSRHMPDPQGLLNLVFRVHLCAFFIKGDFLQLARRLLGMKYFFTRKPQDHRIQYNKIGYIMLIQLTIEFILFIVNIVRDHRLTYQRRRSFDRFSASRPQLNKVLAEKTNGGQAADIKQTENSCLLCNLCYDMVKYASATPCGHIFCWECILKSCLNKPECPTCRQTCKPNKIVQLRNFS